MALYMQILTRRIDGSWQVCRATVVLKLFQRFVTHQNKSVCEGTRNQGLQVPYKAAKNIIAAATAVAYEAAPLILVPQSSTEQSWQHIMEFGE